MQQLHQSVRDLPVPQPVQVRGKRPGQQHEHTHIDRADPHTNIITYVFPMEQEELHGENEAGGKVEQEENPVSQQRDPGPGEAVLPDAMGPRHHVEPNVAEKNERSADECSHKEVEVDPHHVLLLNEAKGDEDQTHSHLLIGIPPLYLHNDHQGERVHGCQHPHPHQNAMGACRWQNVMVTEWPANRSVGVHHHEGDGEDGTAVGGDGDGCDQLTNQPGHVSSGSVTDHHGHVEDEEEHVCCQGVGHQQVTCLLTQGTGQEDACQENGVGQQGGQSDDRSRDEKIVEVPPPQALLPFLREVGNADRWRHFILWVMEAQTLWRRCVLWYVDYFLQQLPVNEKTINEYQSEWTTFKMQACKCIQICSLVYEYIYIFIYKAVTLNYELWS